MNNKLPENKGVFNKLQSSEGLETKNLPQKNIIFLSLGFAAIFVGFSGAQQYITSFFAAENFVNLGFNTLIILYLTFALSSPIASVINAKWGAKNSIAIAAITYSVFIISLVSSNKILIYLASIIIGFGAALLWTGQGAYLVRASEKKHVGKNAGIFTTFFFLSSAIGIFLLGQIIKFYSYKVAFIIAAIIPLLGLLLFSQMYNFKTKAKVQNKFKLVKKAIQNKTAIKLSTIWFSQSFVFGLSLGLIPLATTKLLGTSFVSYLMPLFYVIPIALGYIIGKTMDNKGIGKILYLSYATAILALIALFISSKSLLIIGIVLLALSFASMRIVTLALPASVTDDNNLEYLQGLFWLVQNIGTVTALLLSKFIQSNFAFLIALIILIITLIIILKTFKMDFSKQKFEEIKITLSKQIK